MNVIDTESCYVIIDKTNDKVIKIFKPYWVKKCPWMVQNEVRALKRLKESKHVPKLISYDENSITMEDAGESSMTTKNVKIPYEYNIEDTKHIPDNFEEQVNEILDELEKANLRHSDINGQHFLIKNGIVKLIDFELCLEIGEREPKGYPKTQGIEAKMRNWDEPINDRLMAHRTILNLRGKGLQKVSNAIKQLPNNRQYHELPFTFPQKTERKYMEQRIKIFESVYNFKDKKGIDLGCNVGGITFSLAMKGAKMTGVDIKPLNIEIANACENYYKLGCNFVESKIEEFIYYLPDTHFDFCIFLATWHWIVKQQGIEVGIRVLKKISKTCDTMFFEINFGHEEGLTGSEETMEEIGLTNEQTLRDFIIKNTDYTKVKNIGKCIGWNNRPTFVCTK